MGGMIAQVMTLNYPERVLTLTAIMSTPGFDTHDLSGPHQKFKDAIRASMILNLLKKEEEALIIIERALAGSRFPFDETHFRNEAKKRIQQGQFLRRASISHTIRIDQKPIIKSLIELFADESDYLWFLDRLLSLLPTLVIGEV